MEAVSQNFIDTLSAFLSDRPARSLHHKQCCFTPCLNRGLDRNHHFGFCKLRPYIETILDQFEANAIYFDFLHYIDDLRTRMDGYTCQSCKPKLKSLFDSNEATKLGLKSNMALRRYQARLCSQDSDTLDQDLNRESSLYSNNNDLPAPSSRNNPVEAAFSREQRCLITPVKHRRPDGSSSPIDPVFDTDEASEANTPETEVDLDESFKQECSRALDNKQSDPEARCSTVLSNVDIDDDGWESDASADTEPATIRCIPPYRPYSEQTVIPAGIDDCSAFISKLERRLDTRDQIQGMIYLGYDRHDPQFKNQLVKIGFTTTNVKERYKSDSCDRNLNMFFYEPFGGEVYRGARRLEKVLQLLFNTQRRSIHDCVFCRKFRKDNPTAHNEWFEVDVKEVMQMIYLFKNLLNGGFLYDTNGRITSGFRNFLRDFVDPQRFIRQFINFGRQTALLQPLSKSYTHQVLYNAKQIDFLSTRRIKLAMERAEACAKSRSQQAVGLSNKSDKPSESHHARFPPFKRGETISRRLFRKWPPEVVKINDKDISEQPRNTKDIPSSPTAGQSRTRQTRRRS